LNDVCVLAIFHVGGLRDRTASAKMQGISEILSHVRAIL